MAYNAVCLSQVAQTAWHSRGRQLRTASGQHYGSSVLDGGVWHDAERLLAAFGAQAAREASRRAETHLDAGDATAGAFWIAVLRAINALTAGATAAPHN